jgi:hypothetical protein
VVAVVIAATTIASLIKVRRDPGIRAPAGALRQRRQDQPLRPRSGESDSFRELSARRDTCPPPWTAKCVWVTRLPVANPHLHCQPARRWAAHVSVLDPPAAPRANPPTARIRQRRAPRHDRLVAFR